jgi:hypothetical protein
MEYDFGYVGNELDQMLHNRKPMSSFCRAISEDIDEFSSQDFGKYVKSGYLNRDTFYINSVHGRLLYTVYTRFDQRWRFYVYKALKKSGETAWSAEHEFLESYLLGYVD